jgi:mitogen-activated protein kinase 1/3
MQVGKQPVRALWSVTKELGHGAHGKVESMTTLDAPHYICARKTFFPHWCKSAGQACCAVGEYQLAKHLSHPNLLPLLGVEVDCTVQSPRLALFFPLMEMSFENLLRSRQEAITIQHVAFWIYQLLCGLQYMHSAGVVHRDIKPANLLVNSNCDLCISDFGLSRWMIDATTRVTSPVCGLTKTTSVAARSATTFAWKASGSLSHAELFMSRIIGSRESKACTPQKLDLPLYAPPSSPVCPLTGHVSTRWYRAPEVILNEPYGAPMDLWSAGVCLGEMLRFLPVREGVKGGSLWMFPGSSCLPMSAETSNSKNKNMSKSISSCHGTSDQLSLLMEQCGDFTFEYIRTMSAHSQARLASLSPRPQRVDFAKVFQQRVDVACINNRPGECALDQAVDLLDHLLQMDPARRLTATQALHHPFLSSFRHTESEGLYVPRCTSSSACDCFRCIEGRNLSLGAQIDLLRRASAGFAQ